MRVTGQNNVSSFSVERIGSEAEIRFYANVEEFTDENGLTLYRYDEYIIRRPWRDKLADDIAANYDVWYRTAVAEEEAKTPVDAHQLRADVDFLQIMQTATMGISLMAADSGSDPAVLEKARQYYPIRWTKEQLQMLVSIQRLTAEDYQAITGEALTA